MRRPLRHGPTRCRLDLASGSPELDVKRVSKSFVVCRRSSGVTLRLPIPTAVPAHEAIAFGGTFAAARLDGVVLVVDTVAGSVETIEAPGEGDVVIDEGGALAWTAPDPRTGATRLWVRDATGLRTVDTSQPQSFGLARDGETVLWGDVALTLVPPYRRSSST